MTKAIEAAVKAAAQRTLCAPIGPEHVRLFNADDARAIITAFLDAAAEDDLVLKAARDVGFNLLSSQRTPKYIREDIGRISENGGKAAILALKETVG
jgi:hypothetical protein